MALGGSSLAAALSPAAQTAVAEFGRLPSVKVYATRRGSRGRCHVASVAFALWLRVAGVENRIIRALGPRPGLRRHLSEVELEALDEIAQHAVLVEEALVCDFTWRMWNSAHPFPRISPLADFAADFARLDDTVCGVCAAPLFITGFQTECRHLTPDEEAQMAARLRTASGADVGDHCAPADRGGGGRSRRPGGRYHRGTVPLRESAR